MHDPSDETSNNHEKESMLNSARLNSDESRAVIRIDSSQLQSEASAPKRLRFMIREGGAVLEAELKDNLIIGRRSSSGNVDIDLLDHHGIELGISRHHVTIEQVQSRVLVRDVNSVNGTTLNGKQMVPTHVYELNSGDELKLGRMHIKVYF